MQQIISKNLIIGLALLPSFVMAASGLETTVTQTPAQEDECSKDLLLAYFPKVFVDATLGKFNVPKDQWDAIDRELAEKDKNIIKTVESKAEKMNPNPLKDPQQRQVAVKLFRETLLDSFSSVMKAHGISDDKKIQEMLDDIQQQKAKRFAKCMQSLKQDSQQSSNDTDDTDDTEE